jgi:hypothetical protein
MPNGRDLELIRPDLLGLYQRKCAGERESSDDCDGVDR